MGNPPAADVSWLSPLGISITLFLVYGALNVIVGLVIPIISRRLSSSGWPQATIDLMSGLWLGLGILQSAVVWFGLHDGQVWALWVVAAAELAQLAGWIAYGVQTRDWYAPLFIVNAIIIVPATVLGWIGLH